MRALIYFLAAAVALPAIAQKQTGVIEGTLVDEDARPLRNIEIDISRTDYAYATPNRFLLRTDKQGHFSYSRIPTGTYLVRMSAPGGKLLKEVADVRVETGAVQNLSSTISQLDIVRGCVTIRGITFQKATFMHPVDVEVAGAIANGCAREALASIEAAFVDANGISLGTERVEQLVPAGAIPVFHVRATLPTEPLAAEYQGARYRNGRVMNIYVQFPE